MTCRIDGCSRPARLFIDGRLCEIHQPSHRSTVLAPARPPLRLRAPIPAPKVTKRTVTPEMYDRLPTGPRRAVKKALGRDLPVEVTYSCGPWTAADGTVLEEDVWSVAVKVAAMSDLLVMLWLHRGKKWSFEQGWINAERASSTQTLRRMDG
jgi:hypothetical protein